MGVFLRKWLGIAENNDREHEQRELLEAKRALDTDRGFLRQDFLRVSARMRDLMRTWEAANGMLNGDGRDDKD